MENNVALALLDEFHRRVLGESIPRILKCLDMVDENQVWYRQNEEVNSIGNLVLHLCGNARQWILSGLGGRSDARERYKEFIPDQGVPKGELKAMLTNLAEELATTMKSLDLSTLLAIRRVQVYEESGVSILVHVIEHFSYHTGQITMLTKQMTNRPTDYYGEDLEI